ncbi:MAG: (2Fe-2S)-binding protein [Spirochaetales bacterium]|nr:(2Fe-2S)-binding protein [Spirochaetales bacterium]
MIRIKGREQAIPSSPAVSLLNLLQRNSVSIDTVCGGRAQCGRCLVRVLSGSDKMNRKSQREIVRLQALGAGEEMRLACQSYTRGDIEIEIIHPHPGTEDSSG